MEEAGGAPAASSLVHGSFRDDHVAVVPAEDDSPVNTAAAPTDKEVAHKDAAAFKQETLHPAEGLTTEQYQNTLAKHGYNEVKLLEQPLVLQLLSRYLGIVPLFITTTAALSAAIESECNIYNDMMFEGLAECECADLRDWASFILLLIELNLVVLADFTGSRSSGDAIRKLQEASASQVGVKRDGAWVRVPTRELVPGDLVAVTIGMTIPADGVVASPGEPLKLDYSSLTGEPLPEKKYQGDAILSGAVVLVGEGEMVVTRTGAESSLGTTQALIAEAKKEKETGGEMASLLSKVVIFLSLFGIVISVFVGAYTARDFQYNAGEAIKGAFVLLSTILPVTMPLILTTTLAVGAQELAKDDAVVQRFSSIPELAHMDILCSDKTGTLTLGQMTCIKEESIVFHDDVTIDEMMELALVASRIEHSDAIDAAITKYFDDANSIQNKYEVSKFIPFDPATKRVTVVAKKKETDEEIVIVKGAPPILLGFSGITEEVYEKAQSALTERSERGYKTLAVCTQLDENEWKLLGLISILDPPRSDTAHTVKRCSELGVSVKMITGDQRLIAIEVARQLQLPNLMMFQKDVFNANNPVVNQAGGFGPLCEKAGGFAGVSPEHKHRVVDALQELGHFVGMTGDGVNDAPALSKADVGIAVAGATDAARGASDIVLQQEGLSTIVKALYGSRKIFKRIETYLTYRLASSFIFGLAFTLIYAASEYNFPTWTLILMSLLNDFAVTSSSKDNVIIQRQPVSLDIWKVGTVAAALAITASLQIFGLTQSIINYDGDSHFWGLRPREGDRFTGCELAAYIFLVMIITIQFNLIIARSPKLFFMVSTAKDEEGNYVAVPPPSVHVLVSIGLSLTAATFICVYWDDSITMGSGFGMQGMGWRNAGLVWAWAIVFCVAADVEKMVLLHLWDMVEREGGSIKVLFQNIFSAYGKDFVASESEDRLEQLRDSLRKYDVSLGSAASAAFPSESLRLGGPSNVSAGLALVAQDSADDQDRIVTMQDVLFTSNTLRSDPQLLRIVSHLLYSIEKMQDRLDALEGSKQKKSRSKLSLFKKR